VLFKAPSSNSSQTSCQGHPWSSLGQYSLLEGHESPALNLANKPPDLPLTPRVSRATKMCRAQQWDEYWSYSLQQTRLLTSYNKIQLLVGIMGPSQSGSRGKTYSYSYQYLLLQSCVKW